MTVVESVKETVNSALETVGIGAAGNSTASLSKKEMSDARLPIQYRDSCAHLLVPLNRCRFEEYYLPWKCENERHSYEKCQYVEFKKRVKAMDKIRKEKGGERSN